jgi:hypothetical protein
MTARMRPRRGMMRIACRPLAPLVLATAVLLAVTVPSAGVTPEPGPSTAPMPSPTPGILDTGDPRSNGQGPGLVGSPFAVVLGVVALGVLAAGGTLLYLRLTQPD